MKKPYFFGFAKTRRAAIALTLAIALVPLVMLIGIAVDFTILSQARTQSAFASHAAAVAATRTAAATYAVEVSHGTAAATAASQAINSANEVGNVWFDADLGSYSRATLLSRSTNTTYDGLSNGQTNSAVPPNFTATVTDRTSYPPAFNPIFGKTSNWVYNTSGAATTQFSYAEIVMMLDTSGSMLIGANSSDITTLEEGTVCPAYGEINATQSPGNYIPGEAPMNSTIGYQYQNDSAADDDQVTLSDIKTYTPGSKATVTGSGSPYIYTDPNGTCQSGNPNYGLQPPTTDGYTGNTPGVPCALACHFSSLPSTGPNGSSYTADYYGLARSEGVTLRIDVLFTATEDVISDMESSEAVANQLSVGVYQFNDDVWPIVTGATGSNSGVLPEATTDLASALTAVEAVDYKKTPSETTIPQLITNQTVSTTPSETVANTGGDTNFPLSLSDLEAGHAFSLKNGNYQPITAGSSNGSTAAAPLKFMFIVTDGLEDDSLSNGATGDTSYPNNYEGEMTSIAGETAGTGTCSYLKNTLKFTVYVLYVDYYPLANNAYYASPTPGPRDTNTATNTDFSSDNNASLKALTFESNYNAAPTSPTALALQACASSPNDFYQAGSSTEIQTALSTMLKSALASTIRLTN
jgi:hypothetical protein